MERLTSKDENGVVIGKKPLKLMEPEDVQELLDKLWAYEQVTEYWEQNSKV